MKTFVSILITSLVILSDSIMAKSNNAASQSNQQTTITLIDAEKNVNEQTKLVKGSDITPDCEFPWSVRKYYASSGLEVIDVNNGKLSFQVIPSRGMKIQQITIGDERQNWNSPGLGNSHASFVEVVIDKTPPYRITIRGKVDEAVSDNSKIQNITEISTVPGSSNFQMTNKMDFAILDSKTTASQKPTIKLADVIKSATAWEPSFKEWFGKPAPDFAFEDITGKKHKISDYKGKNLILNFWATWCPPCRMEIPDFIELRKTTNEKDLAIVGISTEIGQLNTVKQFVSQQKMNYTISVDSGKLIPPYSGISAIPTTFFIDPEGKIKLATVGVLNLAAVKNILQAQ